MGYTVTDGLACLNQQNIVRQQRIIRNKTNIETTLVQFSHLCNIAAAKFTISLWDSDWAEAESASTLYQFVCIETARPAMLNRVITTKFFRNAN